MALTVQNLRAVGIGVEPTTLLPGQIAFNITDKVIYVGDGGNFKTNFDGTQVAGVPGEGWYAMPMDFASLGDYYVANPAYYGDNPTDQQVVTWSSALGHPIWGSGGGGGGGQVYVVTNAQVAAASGATTSDKITAAIGVASPDEGNVAIVTGLPDEVYEGLYFFTTEWVKGAAYAYPSASEVIYNNVAHPTLGATVQFAINDLDDGLAATTAIANTANSTANSALSIASAALPKAGGTMTGAISAQNLNLQSGFSVSFAGNGTISGISDSTSTASPTTAASLTGLRSAYLLAQAALPYAGGLMTGTITFAAGQVFPVSGIQDATAAQKGVVQVGTNIDVAGGVISVKTADNANLGLVQTGANVQNTAGAISILDSTTTQKGVVQLDDSLASSSVTLALTARAGSDLQGQIDALTLASNVTLAGSLNATTGLVDSVTTLGAAAGFVAGAVLPNAAPGNADYYVLVTTGGSYNPPGGGGPYMAENGDWFLSNGTAWQYLGVGARPQSASYTTAGIVQLADTAVTYTGTSDTEAVTPNSLQDKLSDSTSLADSNRIASSTAVKSAYDLANAALPLTGGTMTGTLNTLNVCLGTGTSITFNGGASGSIRGISDATGATNNDIAASSTAVKSAYDLANTANTTANAALPKAGGTMTGAIVFVAGQTFPVSGIQDATTGQKGVVQIGTNISVTSGTISVPAATTAAQGAVQVGTNVQVASGTISVNSASTLLSGVVQLNDTVASTSTTQALTANQGYQLQQQINALSTSNNVTFAGTFDAATSVMVTVTNEGLAVGFAVGVGLPVASATVAEYFVIVSVAGTTTPPGGSPTAANVGDWFLASASSWTYIAAGYVPASASTTTAGIVELATNAETQTGTDPNRAVVPSALQSKMSDSTSTTSSTAIASSTAVKSAYDLANAAVPKACYTALGALAAGTGSGTVGTLSVGTNGQSLVVDTTCPAGLKWGQSLAGYTCAATPFNTALGVLAGDSITTGVNNTSLGYNAGTAITGGLNNTFVGFDAGDGITSADNNVAVGSRALSNTGGNNNTAVGYCTGGCLTSGGQNTFIGGIAGYRATTLDCAVAVGYGAMGGVATGTGQVAVGANALGAMTSGAGNTALGFNAGCAITTGSNNTILGLNAGDTVTTGTQNTFIGACSGGLVATTSEGNTGLGFSALGQGVTAGAYNTAIGNLAGAAVTSGALNTLVGYTAGSAITTGGSNTLVGRYTGTATLANNVVLSDGAGTIRFQSNSTGAVSLGAGGVYGTAGQVLTSGGSGAAPTWTTPQIGDITAVTAGTGLTGGGTSGDVTLSLDSSAVIAPSLLTTTGDIIYASAASTPARLGIGTTGQLLTVSGGVPVWAGAALEGYTQLISPFNTALGANAGNSLTSGTNNVSIGHDAGTQISTGTNNVFIGFQAGDTLTTGANNIAIGAQAMCAATAAVNNLAIGFAALGYGGAGSGNTALGLSAGANVTTGTNNTFISQNAGDAITTGSCNIAIGYNSLTTATTVSGNVAIGNNALALATGATNVAVGTSAGCAITTGTTNLLVGNTAGDAITTGSNNTILGDIAGSTTLANNLILAAGTTVKLQVNENGAVGVGTTPTYGTAGQVLKSAGTAAAPAWSSALYGAFSSSVTQTNVGGASGNAVTLDTTASANGFSIVSGSQITATTAGVYNIQISLQVEKTDAGTDAMEIWFKKNGANIANSNTNIELKGGGAKELFALNLVEPLTAGQYLEVWWYSADVNAQLTAVVAGTRPAIPSAIITVVPVGA